MKKLFKSVWQTIMLRSLLVAGLAFVSTTLLAQTTWTASKIGTYNGYDYELWSENDAGTTTMKLTGDDGSGANAVGGTFEAEWSRTINILFRSGRKFTGTTNPTGKSAAEHGNITIDFEATWSSSDDVKMLGVYGWAFFKDASKPTKDENGNNETFSNQIEYYIIQDRGSYNSSLGGDTKSTLKGTGTIDGIEYEFRICDRINKHALTGSAVNFKQYFSVPKNTKDHRTSGMITVSKHFEEWAKCGMIMDGPLYEVALKVESYTGANSNATGNAKITKNILTVGGDLPEGKYSLTTKASPEVGGTITKTPNATNYDKNTSVSIKAVPASGWEFVGWEGDATGTDASTTVEMTESKTVTAQFKPTADGTENLVKDGDFPGSSLTTNWSLNQGQYYGESEASVSVSGGKAAFTITKNGEEAYQPQLAQQSVALDKGMKYRLSFDASAAAARNIQVILQKSTADYDTYFGEDAVALTTTSQHFEYEFEMTSESDENAQLAFNFGNSTENVTLSNVQLIYIADFSDDDKFRLTTTASPATGGTITKTPNATSYEPNTKITLTAIPSSGWEFTGWEGDATGTAATTSVTMDKAKAVTANFVRTAVEPGENLIKNGTFEGSTNWAVQNGGNSAATLSVAGNIATVNITTLGSNAWEPQLVQKGVALYQGEKYRLSFEASAAAAREIDVMFQMTSDPYTTYTSKNPSLTTAMQLFEYEFEMTDATDENAQLAFNLGASTNNVQLQNVQLIKIGGSTPTSSEGYEIATWEDFKTAAVTFTFDDACSNQFTAAVPLFDAKGYKASFYPTPAMNMSNAAWNELKTMAQDGYEIGNHSVTHPSSAMNESEMTNANATILEKIGMAANTVAYPNCVVPNKTTAANYFIGGRICNNLVENKTPADYYEIGSIICGSEGPVSTLANFQTELTKAKNKQGWAVFLIHEINTGTGYSPLQSTVLGSTLDYIKQNEATYWVTTFRNAILYSKERDAATVTELTKTANEITLSLIDNLNDSDYNYPLSLRTALPAGWEDVEVKQGDKNILVEIKGGNIYFNAVPDGGTITLTKKENIVTPKGDYAEGNRLIINEKPLFISGMNIAWESFGGDVGDSELNVIAFEEHIKSVRAAGGNAVRWWLHTDAQNCPKLNEDGSFNRIGTKTISNIQSALDIAEKYGVVVSLCLFSFDMLQNEEWKANNTSYDINRNYKFLTISENLDSYIEEGLRPMLEAVGSHPAILCWEVFNEPEGMTSDMGGWSTEKITHDNVLRFTAKIAAEVHRSTTKMVSTGVHEFVKLKKYSDAILKAAADGDPLAYLDFYMAHYYPQYGGTETSPFHHQASHWNMDRPILIGEFPAQSWGPGTKHTEIQSGTAMNIVDAYNYAYENGYCGLMSWALTEGDKEKFGTLETVTPALESLYEKYEDEIKIKDLTQGELPFNETDVAAINAIITNNGLSYDLDDVENWDFITWNSINNKQYIEQLDISNKGLTGALDLKDLENLKNLTVANNGLTSIDVSGLEQLETLNCSTNYLSDEEKVIGFINEWNESNFIFSPQYCDEHGHIGTWQTTKDATCSAAGEETRTCSRCGKVETQTIDKKEHTFTDWEITKVATCETAGTKTEKCSICGALGIKTEEFPALGHNFSVWQTTKDATCSAAGEETRTCSRCEKVATQAIPKQEHTFTDWEITKVATCEVAGTKTEKCSICGALGTKTEEIPAIAHTFIWKINPDNENEEIEVCSKCGASSGAEPRAITCNHNFDSWEITKVATCEVAGTKTEKCSICGALGIKTEEFPALGHSFSVWQTTKDATCSAAGEETRTCSHCGKKESKPIPKREHTFTDWEITKVATCEIAGTKIEKCAICGALGTKTEEIPAIAHTFIWKINPDNENEEIEVCSKCGASSGAEPRAITCNHNFDSWEITKVATCEVAGTKTEKCSICGALGIKTEEFPALGHSFSIWQIAKAATCSVAGEETRTCSHCGKKESKPIPKREHTFTDWEITKVATCEVAGIKTEKCAICGTLGIKTEEIPQIEHNYVWKVTTPATCQSDGWESEFCSHCEKKNRIRPIDRLTEGCNPTIYYKVTILNGSCDKMQYAAGEIVTIVANNAVEGNVFKQWTSRNVTFENKNESTTTFVMPSQNVSLIAEYVSTAIETLAEQALQIYPNPVRNELFIENEGIQINKIEIVNFAGKVIYNELESNSINVANLPQGIYFIKIYTTENVIVRRFVKK